MFILFSLLFVLLVPNVVNAVVVSSPITTDTTWSPSGNPYIINNTFSVSENTTLTIEAGTIIKASAEMVGVPSIFGRMVVNGTLESPVYFTSIQDDSVGGDSGLDGETTGAPGQWRGLFFKPGSVGELNNVVIHNAGAGLFLAENVGINNDRGFLNIRNSKIYDNFATLFDISRGFYKSGAGIYNKGELTIDNSIVDNHTYGIFGEIGTTTITNTEIKNSTSQGIVAYGFDPITLLNNNFINNKKLGEIEISRPFIHENNTSLDQTERGFEIGGYVSKDTTLHSRDLPIIATRILVEPNATLTIQEGSVIKMRTAPGYGNIEVQGRIEALGTKDKRITITSLRDDSLMGDTNGDGASSPSPRDWDTIYLYNGSEAVFDFTDIKYGGSDLSSSRARGVISSMYDRGANLQISNSSFTHAYGSSLFKDAGIANITKSEIYNNLNYGIQFRGGSMVIASSSIFANGTAVYNEGTTTIDARHNWWGDASGPHDNSTSTPSGVGDEIEGLILYQPFLTSSPTTTPTINPVIIIPGIMGSAYKNNELVIDPILHTYDDLIATLDQNGYTLDVDLFTFPYEWRDSNVFSANLLDEKISEVRNTCLSQNPQDIDCSKVDLVAHSMGGLVARAYIQSSDYDQDVDQVIFLGTPHKGAPKAYLQWEGGEFPPGTSDKIVQLIFTIEAFKNGHTNLFNYIRNRPILSVKELLPIFDYLKDKDAGIVRLYPTNYPTNFFLESLNNNISKLLNSGVEITNIVGNTGSDTIDKIRVVPSTHTGLWEHGEPDGFYVDNTDQGLEKDKGDSTVTDFGSTINNQIQNEVWNNISHINLPKETSARIFNILTGKIASSVIFLSPVEKLFMIQLQSPIDFVITAPDGKKIGKNFATGGEYNEIPGAFYSGFNTEDEYITIPNPLDGEYKVELQGTENGGEYGVLASYITDNFATTTKESGITLPNQITNMEVNVDNTNPDSLDTERQITLDTIINDIKGAYNLGWIKDIKTRDFLIKQAKFILKLQLINGKYGYKVDKILLAFLKVELNILQKKGKITKEAFDLLNEDLKFIINNY